MGDIFHHKCLKCGKATSLPELVNFCGWCGKQCEDISNDECLEVLKASVGQLKSMAAVIDFCINRIKKD